MLFLALIHTKPSSSLRAALQSAREQALLSKIIPFRAFQIIQQAVMRISLKIWLPNVVRAWMIMSKGCMDSVQWMPIEFQQSELKGHSKKRWKLDSSMLVLHKTQELSSKNMFFLLKRFLVFSLSLIRSQAKNLCSPRLPDFQIQVKRGEASMVPWRKNKLSLKSS